MAKQRIKIPFLYKNNVVCLYQLGHSPGTRCANLGLNVFEFEIIMFIVFEETAVLLMKA